MTGSGQLSLADPEACAGTLTGELAGIPHGTVSMNPEEWANSCIGQRISRHGL
jgi:hypothetical protein